MIDFVAFDPAHLLEIHLQSGQAYLQPLLGDSDYQEALRRGGLSWTGTIGGDVVGCSGVLPQWSGRAIGWALFTEDITAPGDWGRILRKTRTILDEAHRRGYRRIETIVDAEYEAAHRWARALGFRNETPTGMRSYSPQGRDCMLYARIH